MSWFSENKLLAGVLAVTVLGGGALGYMAFTAKARYDENLATFQQQTTELNRLERLPAYPDQQSVQALETQRLQNLGAIEDLQKQLAAAQIPSEQVSPNVFQDRLRAAVTEFGREAAEKQVALPANFYLGFDPYATTPPSPEASTLLSQELKAIQVILGQLLKANGTITDLKSFTRQPLPEENRGGKAGDAGKPQTPAKPVQAKTGAGAPIPLRKQTVDLVFVGDQNALNSVLNSLVTNETQFFIPRFIAVENEKKAGPPKEMAGGGEPAPGSDAGSAVPAPSPSAKVDPAGAQKSPIIVGTERVEATMRIEIVEVPEPTPAVAAGGKNAKAPVR